MKFIRKMLRRTCLTLLSILLIMQCIPVTLAAAGETSLQSSIEQQIRSFADSIDQSDTVDDASLALAAHGMAKRGKKLSVGKNHALTALLFNSELLQDSLIGGCTAAIRAMQCLEESTLYVYGSIAWQDNAESRHHYLRAGVVESRETQNRDYHLYSDSSYDGKWNSYDDAAVWIVSVADTAIWLERSKVTKDTVTYTVTCSVSDRFDFDTSRASGFKKLISGFGALLFKEFDWESTVSFQLTVPYTCSHSTENYCWTYDAEALNFSSSASDGYTVNNTTRCLFTDTDGNKTYYYKLDQGVQLRHNHPWVLEYDARNLRTLTLTFYPDSISGKRIPSLYYKRYSSLFFRTYEIVKFTEDQIKEYGNLRTPTTHNYYGVADLNERIAFKTGDTYTFRLENEINPDGSNMIYLTVLDYETGDVLLDKTPMDDYYRNESWDDDGAILQTEESDWLSGKDFVFRYIGNYTTRFSADSFELRVWENGKDNAAKGYFTNSKTESTCTKKGYTTHTCSACGYSYTDSYLNATGHNYNDWSTTVHPTCTEEGSEQRTCKTCKTTQTRDIDPVGHNYLDTVTEPTCTEQGYTTHACSNCGDVYTDTYVDALGHDFQNYVSDNNASYTADGTKTAQCERCDVTDIVSDAGSMLKLEQPIITVSNRASDGKPVIIWSKVNNATSYEVWRCNVKNGDFIKMYTADANDLDIVHTGAVIGNDYFYKVRACIGDVTSEFSTVKGVWCDLRQPAIKVTNRASDGKPVISWSRVEGATGYSVYRCNTKDGTYVKIYTASADKLSVAHIGAKAGECYFYKVQALYGNNKCNSAMSTAKGVYCDLARPNLTASLNAIGKPYLKWDTSTGADSYKVYRSTDGSNWTLMYTAKADDLDVNHTGAKSGTTYYYKVIAICSSNSKGNSAYSVVTSISTK